MGIFGKKESCIGSCDRKLKAGDVCVLKTKIITTFSLKGTEKQLINFVYLLAIEKDENYYKLSVERFNNETAQQSLFLL